jgi:hypothetical protein
VFHPYIARALASEHIADFLRAAEASRRPRIASEPRSARHRRRARRAYPAARVPGQQAGVSAVAGRPGVDRQDGASRYPAVVAVSCGSSDQSVAEPHDDHSGAAVLTQTRC